MPNKKGVIIRNNAFFSIKNQGIRHKDGQEMFFASEVLKNG